MALALSCGPTNVERSLGLAASWYIHVEGKNYGPQRMIGKSQIRDSDLVFVVGGDAWTSAGNDPILGRLFAGHALPEPRRPKASSRVVFVAV
jgi:hypothetical protein